MSGNERPPGSKETKVVTMKQRGHEKSMLHDQLSHMEERITDMEQSQTLMESKILISLDNQNNLLKKMMSLLNQLSQKI